MTFIYGTKITKILVLCGYESSFCMQTSQIFALFALKDADIFLMSMHFHINSLNHAVQCKLFLLGYAYSMSTHPYDNLFYH